MRPIILTMIIASTERDGNFYSTDPEKTYSVLAQARTKLKENKWIIPGQGYDVASDEITHTGRGLRAYYLQIQEV